MSREHSCFCKKSHALMTLCLILWSSLMKNVQLLSTYMTMSNFMLLLKTKICFKPEDDISLIKAHTLRGSTLQIFPNCVVIACTNLVVLGVI